MLRLDTFIVAEFVSMLNFFYKKMPGSRLATPTFIIEPENFAYAKAFLYKGAVLFCPEFDMKGEVE